MKKIVIAGFGQLALDLINNFNKNEILQKRNNNFEYALSLF
jgi:hypothetical protein